ncbi:MAG: FAD-dependent oxidoreductase [Nitrospira sp.]|nr:FAD-dependent oxidoreductase [Nitrospira sp.]
MSTGVPQTVLIVGAGLTGLATALFLTGRGCRITLLDLPGWETGYKTGPNDVLAIIPGGHRETSEILRSVESGVAFRQPDGNVSLEFWLPPGRIVSYRPMPLFPGPLQWISGFLRFRGLAWQDRWRLLTYLERLWEGAEQLSADVDNRTADAWLESIGQSWTGRRQIWDPLSRWLTGNDLQRLSGPVLVQQLSTLFLQKTSDAALIYRHGSIGDRFMSPMRDRLERRGVTILRQTELPLLRIGPNGIEEIRLPDGGSLRAQWYIAALSHQGLVALLPEQLLARYAYFAQLAELETLPEVTVIFRLPSAHPSPRLVLFTGDPFHQAVVAPSRSNETTCRLSASNNSALLGLPDDHLLSIGHEQLRRVFPDSPPLDRSGIVHRDNQAALALHPGAPLRRPLQQSPLPNFLLAGPWTDTGWPANVESALVSARRCADIICARITN